MLAETRLDPRDFVYPLFVTHGTGIKREIASMPEQYQLSLDYLPTEARELKSLGIPAVLLFGLPPTKDDLGTGAYDDDGIVQRAVRVLKDANPDLIVICDVCLCEYTDHGHCGILTPSGDVENDSTLELLARTAVSQVEAGADIVAPSDMMDGHTATSDDLVMSATTGVAAVSWDSGLLTGGESYKLRLNSTGTFTYVDRTNPANTATIIVGQATENPDTGQVLIYLPVVQR